MNQLQENRVWWKHGVFYHIYPQSYCDSNSDGIGDINGIIRKLDYLSELGITAIWLSPVYESPMVDSGYDISDYKKIDPQFGTIDDFKCLLKEAHERGIRVVMDLVMNHTSHLHPWFVESRASRDNPKRDWYIWQDGLNGKKPNNWRAAYGKSAWEYDDLTGQYYLHTFFREMPDLNWRNKEMRKAFFGEVRYWLDLGVDGFRLDVINLIVKDKKFRNNPIYFGIPWIQKHLYTRNRPKSLKITRQLRNLLDEYGDRMSVGEIYTLPPGNPATAADYLGSGEDSLHMTFDFSLIFQPWSARRYYKCLNNWYRHIPRDGWACNVLSNHDLSRSITRFGKKRHHLEKSKLMAVLLLTIKGTPFVYYGEEIGMTNGRLKKNQIVDPLGKQFWPFFKGRDRARTPMQWNPAINAGFSIHTPWLPVNKDYLELNVKVESRDPDSVLNLYKRLISLRNDSPALQCGEWIPVMKGERGILAYIRSLRDEKIVVILNFRSTKGKINFSYPEKGIVILSTHRQKGTLIKASEVSLYPYEGLVIGLNMSVHALQSFGQPA
jgi:alpha-glucosidase